MHFEPVALPGFIDSYTATKRMEDRIKTVPSLVAELATWTVSWHKNALFVVNV